MKFNTVEIEGLIVIEPTCYIDNRGFFMETYHALRYTESIGQHIFMQDNESLSHKNVLRGLHFQLPPFAQGKLVRVVCGSVQDVVVDLRSNSPTFGQYFSILLSAENKLQLWIPPGFAHGFLALENNTLFSYKCTKVYHKDSERTLLWNDPDLNIQWNIPDPIVSEKDSQGMLFKNFNSPF